MKTQMFELNVRVLIYREEGDFVAHALEFDLLGYGKTKAEAMSALEAVIKTHLEFCFEQGLAESAISPAPEEFFERWEKAQKKSFVDALEDGDRCDSLKCRAAIIALDPNDLAKLADQARKMKGRKVAGKPKFEPVLCG